VQEFLTGVRPVAEFDRVLATVMFTDIVGSTETAARLGDRAWRALLDSHHTMVRNTLARFRGEEVNTSGDGFLATFDGPARAIRCAFAIRDGARELGLATRAGLHTGEIDRSGGEVGGIAVHIVTGSGITFADRGMHGLKGVPSEWRLYAASA